MARSLWVLLSRLLLVLALALPGGALAVGSGQVSTCGVSTATPGVSGTDFDLLTFAPDAQCWFNNSVTKLATAGIFHAVDRIAQVVLALLFVTSFVFPLATDPKSRNSTIWLKLAMFVIFGSVVSDAAANKPGNPVDVVRGAMFETWGKLYVPAANAGNLEISNPNGTVAMNLQTIAQQIARINYDSTTFDRLEKNIEVRKANGQLGNTNDDVATNVTNMINADRAAYDPQSTAGMWTNVGFFALLGMFSVFAAIVFSTALGVIIAGLMLPFALCFAAAGNFSPLRSALLGTLASYVGTLVVPFVVSLVIDIALGGPTAAMARQLTSNAQTLDTNIISFAQNYSSCGLSDAVGCGVSNFSQEALTTWEGIRTGWIAILELVLVLMVTMGIGLSQLRRVPSLISGALGVAGGGESSGSGSNPLMQLAEVAGVAAMARGGMQKMAGRAVGGGKGAAGKGTAGTGKGEGAGARGGEGASGGDAGGGESAGAGEGGAGGGEIPAAEAPQAAVSGSSSSASERLGNYAASLPKNPVAAAGRVAMDGAKGAAGAVWSGAQRLDPSLSSMATNAGAAVQAQKEQIGRGASNVAGAVDLARNGRTEMQMGRAAAGQRGANEAAASAAAASAAPSGTPQPTAAESAYADVSSSYDQATPGGQRNWNAAPASPAASSAPPPSAASREFFPQKPAPSGDGTNVGGGQYSAGGVTGKTTASAPAISAGPGPELAAGNTPGTAGSWGKGVGAHGAGRAAASGIGGPVAPGSYPPPHLESRDRPAPAPEQPVNPQKQPAAPQDKPAQNVRPDKDAMSSYKSSTQGSSAKRSFSSQAGGQTSGPSPAEQPAQPQSAMTEPDDRPPLDSYDHTAGRDEEEYQGGDLPPDEGPDEPPPSSRRIGGKL